MIGIGSAIGAGLGAFGSIFGGIAASRAMKKAKRKIEGQRSRNEDWYNRRYNEDATQRASAQAVLSRTEDAIRNRNRAAAGAQAVMGGSAESVAADKAAGSEALASAATNIAVSGEARKDAIEAQYQQKDEALEQQLTNMEVNRAGQTAQAIQGVAQAGAKIANLF